MFDIESMFGSMLRHTNPCLRMYNFVSGSLSVCFFCGDHHPKDYRGRQILSGPKVVLGVRLGLQCSVLFYLSELFCGGFLCHPDNIGVLFFLYELVGCVCEVELCLGFILRFV